jgi:hypothetical protein
MFKKAVLFSAILFSVNLVGCQKQIDAPSPTTEQTASDIILFRFSISPYQPSSGCKSGWGLCNGHLIILGGTVFLITNPGDPNVVQGYIEENPETKDSGKLVFFFENKEDATRPGDRVIALEDSMPIDAEFANGMGYKSLTLKPGKYAFDESLGKYGGFEMDLEYVR